MQRAQTIAWSDGHGGRRELHWPQILVSYLQRSRGVVWVTPPSAIGPGVIEEVLAELEAQLRRGVQYVLVFDLSHAAVPNALQRQQLAAHVRDNEQDIRRSVRSVGVVLTSPIARGIVTAIFWVSPPPMPYRFFTTRAEAASWAEALADAQPAV
jgi:hypothetical protein